MTYTNFANINGRRHLNVPPTVFIKIVRTYDNNLERWNFCDLLIIRFDYDENPVQRLIQNERFSWINTLS